MNSSVRVRMAPSPTGPFHVGSARTALFNYLFARHIHGTFVLRIEDTDTARNTAESLWSILAGLRWMGLDWDEGPRVAQLSDEELLPTAGEAYSDYVNRLGLLNGGGEYGPYLQSLRLDLYREAVNHLLREGSAYRCYCAPEELKARRAEMEAKKLPSRYDGRCRDLTSEQERDLRDAGGRPAVRFRMPQEGVTAWEDLVRGYTEFQNIELDDLIIQKSDGFPTYNFAAVIDDALMEITHVLRGEDGVSNTPKQMLIYRALGKPIPIFAHVPLILGKDRSKLSKRHGATALLDFREKGVLPDAMVNYLALLGWSPGKEETEEVLSREELIRRFCPDEVNKAGAIFDFEKLEWMNGEYIRMLPLDELVRLCLPYLARAGFITLPLTETEEALVRGAVALAQERLKYLADISQHVEFYFTPADRLQFEDKAREKWLTHEDSLALLAALRTQLVDLPSFDRVSIEAAVRNLAEDARAPASKIIHPTRVALSGRTWGPGLFDMMQLLGREQCLARLERVCCKPGAAIGH